MIARITLTPLLLVGLLISSIIFIGQNQKPVALVFFGTKTTAFPVFVWVLLFVGGGLLTSLFSQFLLQLLSQAAGKPTPLNRQDSIAPPQSPPPNWRKPRESSPPEEKKPLFDKPVPPPPDWGSQKEIDEWDVENPPQDSTPIRDSASPPPSAEEFPNFEVRQQPQKSSRQGSVYSYTYREAKSPRSQTSSEVYDANYRVITPPYQATPPQQTDKPEDEEDWI